MFDQVPDEASLFQGADHPPAGVPHEPLERGVTLADRGDLDGDARPAERDDRLVAEPAVHDLQAAGLRGAHDQRLLEAVGAKAVLELVAPMRVAERRAARRRQATDLDLLEPHRCRPSCARSSPSDSA